ncbi:C4-dicarboxylate anaerobic carrier [uncultured Clostridium sp.]|uniref:YfcC family protein n=1 Tax=uncultured Clostridium sp. TaxID=59620 RepID=UPI000820D452|nr:YfcC family protein [uncultured Clostridium sp.]SCK01818.1 C4-dicarboxylate anaerobic carrier [uncultured Clostridium sp.]
MLNLQKKREKSEDVMKKEMKMPHTLVIIFAIIILVSIATYFVPGGAYERAINEAGKTVVVDGTFSFVESNPQGLFAVLQAPLEGIMSAAEIIAFLFVVGGAINVVSRTKAIDLGIVRLVDKLKGKEILIIPILTLIFSIGGAVFGMSEEAIPFITLLLPLMLALGYDSILTVAVTYFACILGFSTAMLNPFTVHVAQNIAGVEIGSGVGFRTVAWVITTAVGIAFLMYYAKKIKKDPTKSLVYESDRTKKEKLEVNIHSHEEFTIKHKVILSLLAISIGVIIWGVLVKGFYISEIAAVFLAMGLLAGIIGRLSVNDMADAFIEGAKGMIGAAVIIGCARGIVIIAENAQIIDTVLYGLVGLIGKLPSLIAAYLMYIVQMIVNFFIISGSGQAAVTMPLLAPLGDLVGVQRQLSVLIFQLGDGFSNAIFPTSGILIASLGLAGVPYSKWVKWILPIQAVMFLLSLGFITVAMMINWV